MLKDLPDIELWEAIKENDAKAFAVLFDRYWSKLFTTAFKHLKDSEACAEVTHDIFLNLWLKRDRLNILSFPNYLQASVRYHVYRYKKTLRAIPIQYTDELENIKESNFAHAGDYDLRYYELENTVNSYLSGLPERCREIFLLSRKDQLTNDEIAIRLSISKRTVENQITHALRHIRSSLKDVPITVIIALLSHRL